MVRLIFGGRTYNIKSNLDLSVSDVASFNTDPNIDLDLVSFVRIVYPRYVLSSGSMATVKDKELAKKHGIYFSNQLDLEALVGLIENDPHRLAIANEKLAKTEVAFARILKNRSPLYINKNKVQALINKLNLEKNAAIKKNQPFFSVNIEQKTAELRQYMADRYSLSPNNISKESIAISDIDMEHKSILFDTLRIYNIQQEITNLSKLSMLETYGFSFIPFGSVSGRVNTFGENIQGLSKEQFSIFDKKVDGYRLCSIDFSQIELRLAAYLWGDTAMRKVFASGGDIHTNTAAAIGSKGNRTLAKAINFGLLYGMGVDTFIKYCAKDFGILLTKAEATRYITVFKKTYPALFNNDVTSIKGLTYSTKTLGRTMHAQDIFNGEYEQRRYTTQRNIQIQGEGADILKIATIELAKILREKRLGNIAFTMHDELAFYTQEEGLRDSLNYITHTLENFITKNTGFNIPISISERF